MSGAGRIAVVGGGLVGRATAIALARAGRDVVHLAPPAPPDRRTSALMQPSIRALQSAGLLDDPAAIGTRLRRIRIIDATGRLIRAPETLFDSGEIGLDAFGWNIANTSLAERFETEAAALPGLETLPLKVTGMARSGALWVLTLEDGRSLEATLVVGADGKASPTRAAAGIAVRERRLAQHALVADLDLTRGLDGTSVEFHYPQGPFTLVPAGGNRANLVWIDRPEVLERAASSGLAAALAEKSQHLFGAISISGRHAMFPLSTLSAAEPGRDGVVLVGEAAHAFPPIGAQGLNLGLRDLRDLLALIGESGDGPGWAHTLSRNYAVQRRDDIARTGMVVDGLFFSLVSDLLPAQALRTGGLWALRTLPALRKRAFAIGLG